MATTKMAEGVRAVMARTTLTAGLTVDQTKALQATSRALDKRAATVTTEKLERTIRNVGTELINAGAKGKLSQRQAIIELAKALGLSGWS